MVNNKKKTKQQKQAKVTTTGNANENTSSKGNESVSIVTVTQLKRFSTIKLTLQHIIAQKYKNIIEWVIVEGSNSLDDCLLSEQNIKELSLLLDIPIVYILGYTTDPAGNKYFNDNKLGQLRNLGNQACKGDITVCMDDDDYYPPTRVSHVVEKFNSSKALIAGCSAKYLYDYGLQKMYLFKPFGPNHSTNDCMAWRKEYLLENSHDPTKSNAEEASFTKTFANQMVQLDARHTIIGSSHTMNTFSKKEICIFASIGIYPNASIVSDSEIFMSDELLKTYTDIFNVRTDSEYDIIYYTGGTSIDWEPNDPSLGGSEQAVVNLSESWVRMGKKVAVYGKITINKHNGVDYFDWKTFDFTKNYSTVIMWRAAGINCLLQFPVVCKKLYADFHDNMFSFRFDFKKYSHKIDCVFLKSEYHLDCYIKELGRPKEYQIIPNGIRVNKFEIEPSGIHRNPYRFCYCSCYTRGLMELLANVWPYIYRNEPRAELHVYYGMAQIQDENFLKQMSTFLAQPGVMDHSRQSVDMIIREKYQSTFHLYISNTDREIDCISIRESLVAGCIPLISDFGVFAKREGLRFKLENTQEAYSSIIRGILGLMQKPDFIELCRERFKRSDTIRDWDSVAEEWLI